MADKAIGSMYPTMYDVIKSLEPNGGVRASVVEIMTKLCPIVADAPVYEGNLPTGNRTTRRTTLPTAYTRALNVGVLPSKSGTDQFDDPCTLIEAWLEMDTKEYDLNGGDAYLANQGAAFTETLTQTLATQMFYGGDSSEPDEMVGLYPRYTLGTYYASPTVNTLAFQVVGCASGSGSDLSSAWIVNWGVNTVHLCYPKGTQGGLSMRNLGRNISRDSAGRVHEVINLKWEWNVGLVLRDPRSVVRVANIDEDLSESGVEIESALVKGLARLGPIAGNTVIYCNRVVHTLLELQRLNKGNVQYLPQQVGGVPVLSIRGVPIKRVDQISQAESALSFT